MNTYGWIFMIFYWLLITALTIYSFLMLEKVEHLPVPEEE